MNIKKDFTAFVLFQGREPSSTGFQLPANLRNYQHREDTIYYPPKILFYVSEPTQG